MQAITLRAGTALRNNHAAAFALALSLSLPVLALAADTASAGILRGR